MNEKSATAIIVIEPKKNGLFRTCYKNILNRRRDCLSGVQIPKVAKTANNAGYVNASALADIAHFYPIYKDFFAI